MRDVKRNADPPVVDGRLVARRYAAVLTRRFSVNAYAKLKNLTPDQTKKLKETQFETIKLMSVENRVVFSDCLTIYFVRIPKAGEPFSPDLRDPKLIDWLKAFRFPESTSAEEMFRLETTSPELKELRKQMFEILASPERRDYLEQKQRFYTLQRTILEENETQAKEIVALSQEIATLIGKNVTLVGKNATLADENATLVGKNATLTDEIATLTDENATLIRRQQERDAKRRSSLIKTASDRFGKSVLELESLFEGRTQEAFDAALDSLLANDDYDEFVKVVSKER